jgi:hypothetical protein
MVLLSRIFFHFLWADTKKGKKNIDAPGGIVHRTPSGRLTLMLPGGQPCFMCPKTAS